MHNARKYILVLGPSAVHGSTSLVQCAVHESTGLVHSFGVFGVYLDRYSCISTCQCVSETVSDDNGYASSSDTPGGVSDTVSGAYWTCVGIRYIPDPGYGAHIRLSG